jgi:peptidoglycan/LPS O-acetylase OafA/YrhL
VLLFFVLSGYALSCAVIGDRGFACPRFLIRRTCRIWVPYAAAILLAAAVWSAIPPHALPGREAFVGSTGLLSPDTRLVLGHLAMTGETSALSLDPPAWSLVHEMRISAVFPLLLLCCRLGLPLTLAAFAALHAVAGVAVGCEARPCTPYEAATVADSFLLTAASRSR